MSEFDQLEQMLSLIFLVGTICKLQRYQKVNELSLQGYAQLIIITATQTSLKNIKRLLTHDMT